jgi:hypothetical protein
MKTPALLLLLACSAAACGHDPSGPDPRFVTIPSCLNPAPLRGERDARVPDQYIVVFHDGVDPAATAATLAARYGFQTRHVYEHALLGFSAAMDQATVARLRCEASVKTVDYDAVVGIGD